MSGWAAAFLTNLYDKVINKVGALLGGVAVEALLEVMVD